MRTKERERRDWTLLVFVIPIGILLMFIAGQLAVRILPNWSINAGMKSNLDPESSQAHPFSILQPILPQILTPMGWAGIYLTPSGDIEFPPFFVFRPGASSPTAPASPTPVPPSPTPPATSTLATSTRTLVILTATKSPGASSTPQPPSKNTNTPIPTKTKTKVPAATKTKVPTATTEPPTEPPTETPTEPPTEPPPTGYPSTPPPGYTPIPPPPGVGVGPPGDGTSHVTQGDYFVLDLGVPGIVVDGDNDYDLVYYEVANGPEIRLDMVVLGISTYADGQIFFEVFNWCNWGTCPGVLTDDTNTHLFPLGVIEEDNQRIPLSDLYNFPGTGVLINVDGAASEPPPGTYRYLVVLSPLLNGGDSTELDGVDILP